MIDLHCHLLPTVDDGPSNLETSIRMAREAWDQGITCICCSPHLSTEHDNPGELVRSLVSKFQHELLCASIPLKLIPAQEVRISKELLNQIDQNEILFIDPGQQYFLLEFPFDHLPRYTKRLFREIIKKNHIPIIVHPERNKKFMKKKRLLEYFIQEGGVTQINAGSITGGFGKNVQQTAFKMLEKNLVHTIASDAHDLAYRNICLKEAYKIIRCHFGDEQVQRLKKNAEKIISGRKNLRRS